MAHSNTCMICGRDCCNGIEINSMRICVLCEERMSSIAPGAPEYDGFVRALHDLKLKPTILTAAEADALENELNIYEPVTVDELLARSGLEAQSTPAGKPRRHKLAATGVASDAGNE